MIENYILTAFRILKRNLGFTIINILGLAVGMATFLLLFLWISNELSYDKFVPGYRNIYRVNTIIHSPNKSETHGLTVAALPRYLKNNFPEVESYTRLASFQFLTRTGMYFKTEAGQGCYEPNGYLADSAFFNIFDVPLITGDKNQVLKDPNTIVITESMARKHFGNQNPVGKLVTIDKAFPLKVSGVMKDWNKNSHLNIDFVVPLAIFSAMSPDLDNNWKFVNIGYYVKLKSGINAENFSHKIQNVHQKVDKTSNYTLQLQPLADIHLKSAELVDNIAVNKGNFTYVVIFILIAALILIIACINFVNLSTARAIRRAREVGVRKISGAGITDLRLQFFFESLLLVLVAHSISLIIVELSMPTFNTFTGQQLELTYSNPLLLLELLIIVVVTSFLAGSYPAIFMSAYKPVSVLKRIEYHPVHKINLWKVLVTAQFTIVVFLITSTFFIREQTHYMRSKNTGLSTDHIIYFLRRWDLYPRFDALKNDLLTNPEVQSVTTVSDLPFDIRQMVAYTYAGKKETDDNLVSVLYTGHDFLPTFNIQLKEGRYFTPEYPDDALKGVVVNETLVQKLGLKNPLGSTLTIMDQPREIVGVIKDFNFTRLTRPVASLAILPGMFAGKVCVRFASGNTSEHLAFLENAVKKYIPDAPMEYFFADEVYQNQYKSEQKAEQLFKFFTLLGIFVAGIGMFGMAGFISNQQAKASAIRKIHGASAAQIVILQFSKFTKLILTANIIALPLTYWAVNTWLQGFSYRISITPQPFLYALGLSVVITLVTVVYQAVKTSVINPAASLKYE